MLDDPSIDEVRVRRIGEGFGLASTVARVDVGAGPPLAFKLCAAVDASAEARAYRDVLARTPIEAPRFVASTDDGERGVLVTELIEGRQGDVLAGCDSATTRHIISMLATLHAIWWEDDSVDVPVLTERLNRPLAQDDVDEYLRRYAHLMSRRTRQIIREYPSSIAAMTEALSGQPTTLTHSDVHLDNVIIDHRDRPILLDWVGVRRAPAAVDVARCLVELVGAPVRSPDGCDLVDVYLGELVAASGPTLERNRFDRALDAAVDAFAIGTIRWGVRRGDPSGREAALIEHTVRRLDAVLDHADAR